MSLLEGKRLLQHAGGHLGSSVVFAAIMFGVVYFAYEFQAKYNERMRASLARVSSDVVVLQSRADLAERNLASLSMEIASLQSRVEFLTKKPLVPPTPPSKTSRTGKTKKLPP